MPGRRPPRPTRKHVRRILVSGPDPRLRMVLEHVRDAFGDHPPGIVPLEDLDWDESSVVLRRPFVDGVPLDRAISDGPLDVRDALDVARGILRGLQLGHQRGVLHGDIRPCNVILDRPRNVRDVALVDWGVAEARREDLAWALYLAPEQTGVLDGESGEWSDLYSVGAILYACLTGQPPYPATDLSSLLRRQLSDPVPSVRAAGAAVPAVVDEIVARLLQKDPRERYHTCLGALQDLDTVAVAVARGQEPELVVGAADRRRWLAEAAFLGRREAIGSLRGAIPQVEGGRPALVCLEAESGGGKTRLLQEFANRARLDGAWVLRGQGTDQSAPRPFALLSGLVPSLLRLPDDDPGLWRDVQEAVGDLGPDLVSTMPALEPLFGPASASGPEEHGAGRAVRAWAVLLASVGRPGRPALLLWDDLQWCDAPSRMVLEEWWRRSDRQHVGIIAAYRSDEVSADHPLRLLEPTARVSLPPFSPAEVRDLVTSMAGNVPDEAVATVVRLSSGNPFLATAALRGLVESRVLTPGREGWVLGETAGEVLASAPDMARFLLRRLKALPPKARTLVEVGAVLGKEFDIALAASLAGLGAHDALSGAAEARRRHILVRLEVEGRLAFTHDKIREAVLESLDPARRSALHRSAAQRLLDIHAERTFELAYHFDAAGRPQDAYPFAVQAAEEAKRRFALDVAERYFHIALRGLPGRRAERVRALHGLGDVLMLRGAYAEAAPWLERASDDASSTTEKAAILGKVAELAFRQGDLKAAERDVRRALRLLGQPAPSTRRGHLMRLPAEVLVQVAHSLWPRRLLARRGGDEHRLLAVRLYSLLAHVDWFLRGPTCCAWAHLREMNLAETMQPSAELAKAYAEHTVVMTTVPWNRRGIRYGHKALAIREDLEDLWGQAHARHFRALGNLASGQLGAALEDLQESTRIFERTGDLWQANNAGWHVALLQLRMGRPREALQTARQFWEQADRIGDLQNTGLALEVWTKAGGDGITDEMVAKELARCPTDDAQTREAVLQAAAVHKLNHGAPREAAAFLAEAYRVAGQASLRSEYVAAIPAWMLTALRTEAESLAPWAGRRRRQVLRAARRWSRRARSWSRRYPNHRPQVLRESGRLAALAGKRRRADRLIAASVAAAQQSGMAHEAALSHAVHEQLETDVQPARPPGPGTAASMALIDRFQILLEVGRALAAAIDRDAVRGHLQDGAARLLRGGVVLHDGLDDVPSALRSLAQDAAASDEPKLLDHPTSGLRSALVAAVGPPDARVWVVASNAYVEGLYGDQDVQVMRFLAGIGGAALEGVAHYDALRFQTSLLESQHDAMQDGVLVVDPEGQMVSFNKAFVRMWNLPADVVEHRDDDEAIGSVLGQLKDPEAFVARVKELYDDPTRTSRDLLELRDGRMFDRYSAPVRGADGHHHGRIWLFRDITEQRRYQDELQRSYERLQRMDADKARFINTAAHELNTPLTPIRLQLFMLQESSAMTPEQRKAYEVVTRNFGRLEQLVHDILDAARAQQDGLSLDARPLDASAVVRSTVESFAPQARSLGIALTAGAGDALPVHGDRDRLLQVLYNLTSNALRFTPAGGTVTLEAREHGRHVCLSVTDTGPGIPDDKVPLLFQPFSQPVAAPVGRTPGTGLGLCISKGIVEQHGGRIKVESTPGQGSRFEVWLPRREA